jgi:serine/threonine protein kinase
MLDCLIGVISTGTLPLYVLNRRIQSYFGFKQYLGTLETCETQGYATESYIRQKFETTLLLGEGSCGTVWKVRSLSSGKTLAMKVVQNGENSGADAHGTVKKVATEIRCLQMLRHPHITMMSEYVRSDSTAWILLECLEGGDLYNLRKSFVIYSESMAAGAAKQVLSAVSYMHSRGVVHRDLKLENILVSSRSADATLKIADFGLAVVLEACDFNDRHNMKRLTCIKGSVGSPICMAPEVARTGAAYGPQCDIWSVGCIAYELLSGRPPFTAKSKKALIRLVRLAPTPCFNHLAWQGISEAAKDACANMLQKSPEVRFDAKEALEHRWGAYY